MKTHSIQTTKTARYYTIGELGEKTTEIIFVFHGYAQLAKDFIQNFESILNESRFIIAPEGLNKFYSKGFFGKVGASWMTKEDRENEIKGNLNFCDNIYNHFAEHLNEEIKIKLFGFSQGGATASRWFVNSKLQNAELILWGSSIPHDIDYQKLRSKLIQPVKIIIGGNDEFISNENLTTELNRLKENEIEFELKKYPGKHNIQPGLLKKLNLFD